MMTVDVVVIGGAVAGTNAALALQERGYSTALSTAGAAGSWFWSGVASVFGPSAALPDALTAHDLRVPGREEPMASRSRDERWAMLRERAPHHPYFVTNSTADGVADHAKRAARRLGLPLQWPDEPAVVLTDAGTTRLADAYVDTMAALTPGRPGVVFDDQAGSEAEWIAHGYRAATAAPCRLHSTPSTDSAGDEQTPLAIVPALVSARFEDAEQERSERSQQLGCDVGECAGTIDSRYGERLRALLIGAHNTLERLGPLSARPAFNGGWEPGIACTSGQWRAHALLLATGGALGRGPLSGWSQEWRRATLRSPSSPWRAPTTPGGFEVDAELRLRVRDRSVQGVWVAGAGLAGHDPSTDETGMGVALWSSELAANTLADALDARGHR